MLPLPARNETYAEADYWESRFQTEREYEWFKGYEAFRSLVELHIPDRASRVLVLGCGTSRLAEDMHTLSGYQHIVSTDLSPTLIEKMRERALEQQLSTLRWEIADFTALPYEQASFDVVIEKGAIDCLLTTVRDPWNLPPAEAALCKSVLEESHRVLTSSGVFISVTFSAPHFRRPMLYGGSFSWRVQCETFGEGDSLHYHLYACRKGLKGVDEPGEEEAKSEYVPPECMAHEHMDDADEVMRCMGGAVSDSE